MAVYGRGHFLRLMTILEISSALSSFIFTIAYVRLAKTICQPSLHLIFFTNDLCLMFCHLIFCCLQFKFDPQNVKS